MHFLEKMQVEMREFECGLDSYIRQNETARCNQQSRQLTEEAKSQTKGKAVTLKFFHVKKQPKRAESLSVFGTGNTPGKICLHGVNKTPQTAWKAFETPGIFLVCSFL